MKKIVKLIAVIFAIMMLTSCTPGARKSLSQRFTYKDPQTIGGRWTVIDGAGNRYEHCECTYWGTDDDTAMFDYNGSVLCVSGNVTTIQE